MYYSQLDTQEKALVESRLSNEGSNLVIAYLLLFFGGAFGLHRFYIEKGMSGIGLTQLILTILGYLTLVIFIGFIFFFIVGIWVIVDMFLVPGLIKSKQAHTREQISLEILNSRN